MWSEVGEHALVGHALIKEAEERVAEIREKLMVAQSRQKSNADRKRRKVSFSPGSSLTSRFHLSEKLEDFKCTGNWPLGTLDRTKCCRELGQ
jgi:hypothetical protein